MPDEQLSPDDEGLVRPFRSIVTSKYLAVRHEDDSFTATQDQTYVGQLNGHLIYKDNVFHICRGLQYLSPEGRWTGNIDEALDVQIDPEYPDSTDSADNAPVLSLPDPIINSTHPVPADEIDLYHPNEEFALYPLTPDGLWYGDASNSNNKLIFGGNPYSAGLPFQLSVREGRTRIRANDGMYLTVFMDDDLVPYLKDEWYSLGFCPQSDDCLAMIPRGLPSMFVLHDGAFYYSVNVLETSYAETRRIKDIEEASLF